MADFRDFYIRYERHPNYTEGVVHTETKIDMIKSKLELIMYTNKGEHSDPNFGSDLEYYIWKTKVPSDKIKNVMTTQINNYIPELAQTEYQLLVNILPGKINDILLLDIVMREGSINAMVA